MPLVSEVESQSNLSLDDFKVEPELGLLDKLLETKLINDIYQIFLNGSAAEHAAR